MSRLQTQMKSQKMRIMTEASGNWIATRSVAQAKN